ncbi:ParA family protein [Nostoc sp. MS1]|uniref:ParA family protein n=1 Tax=Nostoc sp. MS1 TaxID=2764711 RepID=UPI001CC37F58|nr:ParA family protein [Nostoc sp. MS1]BCL40005.1 chromosome partitioning protein Soj [Nostoc sp. MS1]
MSNEVKTRKTRIIAVGNQKGGVAKTSNAVHIAAALGKRGKRCLIFDLDMNQGATRHLGVPSESFLGTFEVLIGEEDPKDVIITPEDGVDLPENIHLIAARRNLEKIDQALAAKDKFFITQDVLINPLRSLTGMYDYIFLDTAPNATTPTIAAYKSAEWFILSATPDPFAIAGLNDALTDIQGAQRHGNPNLRLLGVILCCVDSRTILANSLSEYVEQLFFDGDRSLKFKTTISRSIVVPQAQKLGKTLFETAPNHKVTKEYLKLSKEIEARISEIEKSITTQQSVTTSTVSVK